MGKDTSEKTVSWLWQKILSFFSAIGVINLFSDFFPTLIKWVTFFKVLLSFIAQLRDFVLYPLTRLFDWLFDIQIPVWIRSYLFLGCIIFGAYNHAYRDVCGYPVVSHPLYHPVRAFPIMVIRFIWGVLTFPWLLIDLVKYYDKNRVTHAPNVYEYFGNYIRDIALLILIFIILNYLIKLAFA